MSRKETICRLGFAMSGPEFEHTESAADSVDASSAYVEPGYVEAGYVELAGVEPACVALVPIAPALRRETANPCLPRPDPCFVTQLIATAEQAPQTRTLRRATVADAQAAYRSVTDHNHATTTGIRTQQTS
jgi:hypothetical protein